MYRAETLNEAAQRLSCAIVNAEAGEDIELRCWSRTLRRWRGEILAYFDSKTTNGFVEGIHNKIKLLKRTSYGFRNIGVYVRRLLLACVPTLPLPLAPHILTRAGLPPPSFSMDPRMILHASVDRMGCVESGPPPAQLPLHGAKFIRQSQMCRI